MCSCINCNGQVQYFEIHESTGAEIFTMRKLFICWRCAEACSMACMCCCEVFAMVQACLNYCNGTEYRMVKQPIYPPKVSGDVGNDDEGVGHITMIHRALPITPCCACLSPVRITIQIPTQADSEMVSVMGLVGLLYQGIETPFCIGFPKPTGIYV